MTGGHASPWADLGGPAPDNEPMESTEEMIRLHASEVAQQERDEARNRLLWEKLAPRLTRAGGVVR